MLADGFNEFSLPSSIKRKFFKKGETFFKTGGELSSALKKIGKHDSYTYCHEMRYEVKGETIIKKRQITAKDYI